MAKKNTFLRELKDKRDELINLKKSYISFTKKREASKVLNNHKIQAGYESADNLHVEELQTESDKSLGGDQIVAD